MLVLGLQVLRQASRKVSIFLNDHRIFKRFIWNGADHHQTLLAHATRLQTLLLERARPQLDVSQFRNLEHFLQLPNANQESQEEFKSLVLHGGDGTGSVLHEEPKEGGEVLLHETFGQ